MKRTLFLALLLMAGMAIAAGPFGSGGTPFGGYPASVSAMENANAVYVSDSDDLSAKYTAPFLPAPTNVMM
jgi:hypothetical protein